MTFRFQFLTIILTGILVISCSEENSESLEAESFMRIYDNNAFSDEYSPVDMVQTPDDGYLILATKYIPDVLTSGVYLVKTDKFGKFEADFTLESAYTNPLKSLTIKDDKLYFICMSDDAQAKLVSLGLNLDGLNITSMPLSYPSAATFAENEFLVLSYDQVERKTIVARVALNGTIALSRSFKIADDDSMEDEILKHFLRTGRQFPFQIGKMSSGGYFFNGFSDYTFSLVFTNLSDDDDVDGVVQGQQENGGFSALHPLDGNNFAASYFNVASNYVLPKTTLSIASTTSINDLSGYNMREIVPNGKVQILSTSINGQKVIMYASNTRSKQIGLFVYSETDGSLLGTKYLGFSNPYEVGHVTLTKDGGVAVTGTAYIAGRFPRICLIKLSPEEFSGIIQK